MFHITGNSLENIIKRDICQVPNLHWVVVAEEGSSQQNFRPQSCCDWPREKWPRCERGIGNSVFQYALPWRRRSRSVKKKNLLRCSLFLFVRDTDLRVLQGAGPGQTWFSPHYKTIKRKYFSLLYMRWLCLPPGLKVEAGSINEELDN